MTFNFCPPLELPSLISETAPDGKRQYCLPDGRKVPSVTTVLGWAKRKAIFEWRQRVGDAEANKISARASKRGNSMHLIAESYIRNEKNYYKDAMPDARASFMSIKPFLNNISEVYYQEQSLWSYQLELAGRVDLIAHYDGVLSVIDFKTSSREKKKEDIEDYFQQTAAYAIMHEELTGIPIHNLVIIMAMDEGQSAVFIDKTERHIVGLVKAISDYKRDNKL